MSNSGLSIAHFSLRLRIVGLEDAKKCALTIIDTSIKLFLIFHHISSIIIYFFTNSVIEHIQLIN